MSYLMRQLDPYHGLSRLQRDMDRFLRGFLGPGPVETEELERVRIPSVDIAETEQEVLVRAELPGISKEDLDLEVRPEELILVGQVRHEKEEGGPEETYHRRERVWQRFERRIPLPVEVKTEDVKARLENGVLEVHLPKAEEHRPKLHKVTVE